MILLGLKLSFNVNKKKAQDLNRNINLRRVSVRSCIQLCLYYSGIIGFNSIVGYYNKIYNLNSDSLTSDTIDIILNDLTNLREKSKQIILEYSNYRKEQKRQGLRPLSKNEELIKKHYWLKMQHIWNKFYGEE